MYRLYVQEYWSDRIKHVYIMGEKVSGKFKAFYMRNLFVIMILILVSTKLRSALKSGQ